jgi:hypothetical protein
MSKLRRSIAILTSAMVLSTGALILTTHAADQGTPAPATQPTQGAPKVASPTPVAAKPGATRPPAPGAPQVAEESATIRDDPTIAPDPKQSADNSVSFPNDT